VKSKAATVPAAGEQSDKIQIANGAVRAGGDALVRRHEFETYPSQILASRLLGLLGRAHIFVFRYRLPILDDN
jgi:hypothetical protein